MNKKQMIAAGLCLMLLSGCGTGPVNSDSMSSEEASVLTEQGMQSGVEIEFSNLADTETRELTQRLLTDAGVSAERQTAFFAHVDQFNEIAADGLTDGFERADVLQTRYDPYELQDRWMERYPEFNGCNCRITAFSLFGDFVSVSDAAEIRDSNLIFDRLSLEADPSAVAGNTDAFYAFYSEIPTGSGTSVSEHVQTLRNSWKDRGITFRDEPDIRLISMVFHSLLEEEPTLFVGHTGILLPVSDHELYFLEKLAFQEPYQLVKLTDRAQLNEYLMTKYDTDVDQPLAAPFILENDCLMEGYQRLR